MMKTIAGICRFKGRWPGTYAELEAASYLADRLRGLGREAEIEPIRVRPEYALSQALIVAVTVVSSIISVHWPPVGVAILLFACIVMFGELTTRFYLARLATPSRASQNIVSPGSNPDAPMRLVLTAHYDAARTGATFNDRSVRLVASIKRRFKVSIGPYTFIFWPMMAVLVLASLRLAGIDSVAYTAVQFGFTVMLVVATVLLIDISLSDIVPAANDNASGVAVVLELLRDLDQIDTGELDIWALFLGAEEGGMLGMREYLRSHTKDHPAERTVFLNIDTVGYGSPRYLTREGFIFFFNYDSRLIGLCDQAAESCRTLAEPIDARPYKSRVSSDALVATLAGYPTTTILSLDEDDFLPHYHQPSDTPENVDPEALQRAYHFCSELITRLGALKGGFNAV